MTRDYEAERIERLYGKPPDPPAGWIPFNPQTRKGDTHGPGKLVLTVQQIRIPWFKLLARALWKAGRGYIINWIWKACGEAGEEKAMNALEALEKSKRSATGLKGKPPPQKPENLSQRLLKDMKPTAAAKAAPED